jgi:hypothetical protein
MLLISETARLGHYHLMTPEAFQQMTIAFERFETITIVVVVAVSLLGLAFQAVVLYLMFGKVLIPISRSLCNYLDAQSWHVDHQYRPRPGREDKSDSRYQPKA